MVSLQLVGQRLIALFFLGWVFFSYPILAVFNRSAFFLGIPILYLWIFSTWFLLIVIMAIESERDS